MKRSWVVTVVCASMISLVAGCGGSDGGGDVEAPTDAPTTESVVGEPGTALTPEELTDALTEVGIRIWDDPSDDDPSERVVFPGPLWLLADQVEVMAGQTVDRSGSAGGQLDSLVAGIATGVPFSRLLASYVSVGTSPGAELSRTIMGDQPWAQAEDIVFPDVVIGLFANELGAEAAAALEPPTAPPSDLTGTCLELVGWLNRAQQSITGTLSADGDAAGSSALIEALWDPAADLAVAAGADDPADIDDGAVRRAKLATALAVTQSASASLLRPWTVRSVQDPEVAAFGIDPQPGRMVEAVATVGAAGDDAYAAGVVDCAEQIDVDLPDPASAPRTDRMWSPIGVDAIATGIRFEDSLNDPDTATLRYTTRTESDEAASTGAAIAHPVGVSIAVGRSEGEALELLVDTLLTATRPRTLGDLEPNAFGVVTPAIRTDIADLVGRGSAGAGYAISHADPGADTPTTTPDGGCAGVPRGVIPDGVWTGALQPSSAGVGAAGSDSIDTTGAGALTLTVDDGVVVSGNWSMSFSSTGTTEGPDGLASIDSLTGDLSGTVDGDASEPKLSGSYALEGRVRGVVDGRVVGERLDQTQIMAMLMDIEVATCSEVTGTFTPVFGSVTSGYAVFGGTVEWTGEVG